MKFTEWYKFNSQVRNFYIGSTFFRLFRKNSLKNSDCITIAEMSLEDANTLFGDYEIISISTHAEGTMRGIVFNIYNSSIGDN